MKILQNENGIALITSLMLTLISLTMIMVLMSFVLQGVQASGATKRYANSLEATYGGAELITKEIIPAFFNYIIDPENAITELQNAFKDINLKIMPDVEAKNAADCLNSKLNNVTSDWATTCGAQFKNPDPTVSPDMQFTLSSTLLGFNQRPSYSVFAKIIDTTVVGNTYKARSDFETTNPGDERGDGGSPAAVPSLYTVEITGQPSNNPVERVRLEVLYSY